MGSFASRYDCQAMQSVLGKGPYLGSVGSVLCSHLCTPVECHENRICQIFRDQRQEVCTDRYLSLVPMVMFGGPVVEPG